MYLLFIFIILEFVKFNIQIMAINQMYHLVFLYWNLEKNWIYILMFMSKFVSFLNWILWKIFFLLFYYHVYTFCKT